jgi:hypothetical protein
LSRRFSHSSDESVPPLGHRAAALDAWGRYVEALVCPERVETNVIAMQGR